MSLSVKNSDKHKSIYTEEFKNNISEKIKKWWQSLNEDELFEYKEKMSESLKNSEKHKEKMKTEEYKKNLSEGIKNSENFKKYNLERKGKKRGSYKQTDKNKSRRKKAVLVDNQNNIIKEFDGLDEITTFFNIKVSTASVWLKNNKKINELTLKLKED